MTIMAVGAGNELLESSMYTTEKLISKKLEFVSDYAFDNVKVPVQTIIDYIDYKIQESTQTLDSIDFAPDDGGRHSDWGIKGINVTKYPKAGFVIKEIKFKYENQVQINTGIFTNNRLIYVSLQWIVAVINEFIQPSNGNTFEIICDGRSGNPTRGNLAYKLEGAAGGPWTGYLPSADPLSVLLTYGNGDTTADYGYGDLTISSLPNMNAFSLRDGDLSGILISRNVLKGIFTSVFSDPVNTKESDIRWDKSKLSIENFFKSLFNVIRECTGGSVDLYLTSDPKNSSVSNVRMLVVNGKQHVENSVTAVKFNVGDYVTKEISLESSVPKDLQATIFGAAPGSQVPGVATQQTINSDGGAGLDTKPTTYPTVGDVVSAKIKVGLSLTRDEGRDEAIVGLKDIIRRIVSDEPPVDKATHGTELLPLNLTLKIHGTDGFTFGDTISTDLLPKRYRTAKGKVRVGFTVTKVQHTFSGTGQILWETQLTTVCRLIESNKYSG
jgi:hypothetical protein